MLEPVHLNVIHTTEYMVLKAVDMGLNVQPAIINETGFIEAQLGPKIVEEV